MNSEILPFNKMQSARNKGLTYLLITAVFIVWGIIIHRVFYSDSAKEQSVVVSYSIEKQLFDQYDQKLDTFKLALNYRDPFLGKEKVESENTKKDIEAFDPVQTTLKKTTPPLDWGRIKYAGYIINPKTKSLVSILTVEGKERMVAEGESLGGVKLLKNKRDSVLLSWRGKQKYIRQ